jgi:hypothetical protein
MKGILQAICDGLMTENLTYPNRPRQSISAPVHTSATGPIARDIEATLPVESTEVILYCGVISCSALATDVLQQTQRLRLGAQAARLLQAASAAQDFLISIN